ncbi:MAG: AAA family ATPase [Campylobacterota bacterium]|nr:AAA family ATPase [Campylobacterota bacterium]
MSASINIKNIVKDAGLSNFEFDAPKHNRVGNAPLLDNGLNLMYGLRGNGKSYTSIAIAKESGLPSLFIDLESNGKQFVEYCRANNVAYVYAGACEDIFKEIQELVEAIKKVHSKVFIIIDSYSDIFPDDESQTATQTQKNLGMVHKYFMREAKCPVLILDHATETIDPKNPNSKKFKIEGNKSGKFKKTVAVLRIDTIDDDIKNGTFVTVERSRNQDVLKLKHTQEYKRGNYLFDKITKLISEGKLPEKFTATDLKSCTSGNDRKLWRQERDSIATLESKDGKTGYWVLNSKEEKT